MKTVAQNNINLKIAMAKNNPINPSKPILKYHTPILKVTGQSGNITAASIAAKAPPA